ncbi:MAG: hypothetical protein KIT00_02865 [Rhodospirillales bacterium]|nr:hypothetical protein [Rhodospirillales bacterium]
MGFQPEMASVDVFARVFSVDPFSRHGIDGHEVFTELVEDFDLRPVAPASTSVILAVAFVFPGKAVVSDGTAAIRFAVALQLFPDETLGRCDPILKVCSVASQNPLSLFAIDPSFVIFEVGLSLAPCSSAI